MITRQEKILLSFAWAVVVLALACIVFACTPAPACPAHLPPQNGHAEPYVRTEVC